MTEESATPMIWVDESTGLTCSVNLDTTVENALAEHPEPPDIILAIGDSELSPEQSRSFADWIADVREKIMKSASW